MKRLGEFISRYWTYLLLLTYLIKTQVFSLPSDFVISMILTGLCAYKMHLNSKYDKTTEQKLSDIELYIRDSLQLERELSLKSLEDVYTDIKSQNKLLGERISNNHKEVDEALIKIARDTEEVVLDLKTDVGQVNLAQGIGNGKKQKIFF